MVESAPRAFKFLKVLVMHDLVQLSRQQAVDLCDARVDGNVHVLGHCQLAVHDLIDEFADHVLCTLFLKLVAGHTAVGQYPIEQTALLLFGFDNLGGGFVFSFGHFYSSLPPSTPSASLSCFCLSTLLITSSNSDSSFSLPSILDLRSESF